MRYAQATPTVVSRQWSAVSLWATHRLRQQFSAYFIQNLIADR
ncbi:hypothetical protein [Moorena sp. SIO3I6]|nr:hypothetical protein [Moorena sp. SIO3I6]